MKKIAQLTFHASHNYGSVLQAYALSRQLQIMGYQTEFINLRPKAQKQSYKIITGSGIHKLFHYMIYPSLKERYDEYERFITKVLPITQKEYSNTDELKKEHFDYDAYVVGGDQIWNPVCQDFETAYYLEFLDDACNARKVSYSTSFGKASFDNETLNNIGDWVKKFDKVSVRENTGVDIVKKASGIDATMVCDPVVLIDKKEWDKLSVEPKLKKPYILVYFLENNHGSRSLIDYLKNTLGYDVVIFNEYIRDFVKPYHHAYSASPEKFVGLFKNASFVYTNSFHGTAFATIFEKPFITAIAADQENARNNNDSRKIDYLKIIGLEDRLYQQGTPSKDYLLNVDFDNARIKIADLRKSSLEFLNNALKD